MKNKNTGIKLSVLAFALILCLTSVVNFAEAASGTYDSGSWNIRYDTTSSRYGCSAAPGGTVTGKHINFKIYDGRGRTLNNLHIWLNYLPTVYISDGPFCMKMDKSTLDKMFKNLENFLKKTLSLKSIKSLISSVEGKGLVMTYFIIAPNCNNPPAWDLYSKLICKSIGADFRMY